MIQNHKQNLIFQRMIGQNLPIIDLAPYLDQSMDRKATADAMREACKNVGFFYVKNHGVPEELVKSIFSNSKKFFSLPLEEKKEIRLELSERAMRGYFANGEEMSNGKADFQEGVVLGTEEDQNHPRVIDKVPLHGQNQYPKQVPELKTDIQAWLKELNRLGALIMEVIAESLGLRRNFFNEQICKDHYGMMVLIHYPEVPEELKDKVQHLGEHCDYGFVTILMGDQKGLQAKNVNNEWVDIDPIPGLFVVNIGDMLEKATRRLYKSTPHRIFNLGKERFSIPYHFEPGYDVKVGELDIPLSEDDLKTIERNKVYKRTDEADISKLNRTSGEHYIAKYHSVFPPVAKKFLPPPK